MTDQDNQPQKEIIQDEVHINGDAAKIGTVEKTEYGKMKYISITKEMEKSYLDYAMSVIVPEHYQM